MFRLNKDRRPQGISQAPVYSRGPQSHKTTAVSVPRQGRSKSWVRPQSANRSPVKAQPAQGTVPGVDLSSSSLQPILSVSGADTKITIPPSLPQKGLYIRRKKNTLTRVAPTATSNSSTEGKPVSRTTSQVGRDSRRLIHQGRHKLVQYKSGQHTQQHNHLHSSQAAQTPTALQQYRRFVSAQNRKRAGPALTAPAAKKVHKWVRDAAAPSLLSDPESKRTMLPSSVSYVRSSKNHKLQLVRRRSASSASPATPVPRLQTRGVVLAKQLLSVQSLNRTVRSSVKVNGSGVLKPGKLRRIGGVLYKVGGSKHGKSLQRQVTPKSIKPLLSPEGAYVRQGRHLILKSTLKSPRTAIRRVTTPPSSNAAAAAAAAKVATRQKLVARARKPSRLRRSSQSVQTHCLVFCRTGQCREHAAGKCSLVHDPEAVAVCPRWLQGSCSSSACYLQHQHCPDVMPVCTFYLQGVCTTEDCPYAHVKVDPNAPVCQEFVAGHCPRGVACTKKHLTPRMIRQLRQSRALQADVTAEGTDSSHQEYSGPESQAEDTDLRPSFLR